MINVLLVDDEQLIKSGIRNGVDWEKLGCTVTGEKSDGAEALEFILKNPPDIVISDIRMPVKDGLTLMQEVKEKFPDIAFIFISGHDEFSYVQKALKLGALDYILKPIDMIYLQEQLSTLTKTLHNKSRKEATEEASRQAKIRQFLQQIIFNSCIDEASLREEAAGLNLPLDDMHFQVMSIQIDHYYHHAGSQDETEAENVRRSFYHLVDLFDSTSCYTLTESIREFDLCLVSSTTENLKEIMEDALLRVKEKTTGLPFTVSIGIGEPTMRLCKLLKSYNQAREALELKFFLGDNRSFYYREAEQFHNRSKDVPEEISADELLKAVSSGETEGIQDLIENLGQSVLQSEEPKAVLHWLTSDILLRITRLMEERELSIEEVVEDPRKEWRIMGGFHTAEGILNRLRELLLSIASYINVRKEQHSSQILDRAVKFLKGNYTDGEMSLERAATEVCMSPSYFAAIFKQETGLTFNRFLTKLRIDKAKDLILYTDMKSYEIGPKVGYENPSYFSTVFKKATGYSPSEYRKQYS